MAMKVRERLKSLTILRRERVCESCGQSFACEIGLGGCWCSSIELSEETRQELRTKYTGCLCRGCLEAAQTREGAGAVINGS